jgi:2,3-diaminopropionate biosynthesis protein SbnB
MKRSSDFPLCIVTGRTASRIIEADYQGCVEAIRLAYLAHAEGRSENPVSVILRFPQRPNSRIIALPAHLAAPWNVAGIKWIASFPDNVQQGFPRASAVMVLNSVEDGYPFALLEGSTISAARTAASATLAATCLGDGKRRAQALGIVGNGVIARYVHQFLLSTGWDIGELWLYDIAPSRAERFRDRVCGQWNHAVHIATDKKSLLRCCDLIVLATVAGRLFAHRPLVLHLSLRDIAPEILLKACNIVDDVGHVMQAATSVHLAEQLSGSRRFVAGTLAEVMVGSCMVDHSKPVIFSPFGLGVLDLAIGQWVYERAAAGGDTLRVDDFFGDGQG